MLRHIRPGDIVHGYAETGTVVSLGRLRGEDVAYVMWDRLGSARQPRYATLTERDIYKVIPTERRDEA